MNGQNENEFLKALHQLPIIRRNIFTISERIINDSKSQKEQQKLTEEIIEELVEEMETIKLLTGDEILLIKSSLKILISAQIPFSKMAMKVRNEKLNRPDIFQ